MSDTVTQIQARPKYIQEYDEALLARIFGTPDEEGILGGGLIDDPELFRIPDYVQAGSPLQGAVTGTFDTAEERQAFMDRYLPYFQDETGMARYLPEASAGLEGGLGTIGSAISDYFPDAKTYLDEGRGSVDAKGIYDTELTGARTRADQGTGKESSNLSGSTGYCGRRWQVWQFRLSAKREWTALWCAGTFTL